MVFNNLKLNSSNVIFELDKNYLLLKNLAEKTNSSKMGKLIDSGNKIFEQYDLTKVSDYYASSHPECSVVLWAIDNIRTYNMTHYEPLPTFEIPINCNF